MHKFDCFEYLINDVLLVDFLQNPCADYNMQIGFHEVKDKVDVFIVFSSVDVEESDDVFVSVFVELLQEHYFSERPLSICCILECIEALFKGHHLPLLFIYRFPYNSVSAFT